MTSALILFPGSNRDRDMIAALTKIGGRAPHLVWHTETEIPEADLYVVPGGFSFGDYLRSGAIAARSPVMAALKKKAEKGNRILGVCNGFQTLTESGLLPGALMRNVGDVGPCSPLQVVQLSNYRPVVKASVEALGFCVPLEDR